MHRRSRSASAAPGVRALAFSALSDQPSTLPTTHPKGFSSHSLGTEMHAPSSQLSAGIYAQHAQPHGALASIPANNCHHNEPPHSGSPHTREVSLREALHLEASSGHTSAPQSYENRTGRSFVQGGTSRDSIELRPHSSSPRHATQKQQHGARGSESPRGSSPRREQHQQHIGTTGSHTQSHSGDCNYSTRVEASQVAPSRGRRTSSAHRCRSNSPPSRAAQHSKQDPEYRESKSNWHRCQQRVLDDMEGKSTTNALALQEQGDETVLHTAQVPALSPGKRRACRSTSPVKKAANSGSHRSLSPVKPTISSSHALVPWRSPGKGNVLLGRSGM